MTCERFHFQSTNPEACLNYQEYYDQFLTTTHPCARCPNRINGKKPPTIPYSMGRGRPRKDKCPECGTPYEWKEKKFCKNPNCETGKAQMAENRRLSLEYYHNHKALKGAGERESQWT